MKMLTMRRHHSRGVTLLELMTVVVIVGILASIAIPSYRRYVVRAQRADATAALLRIAAAQEKFYLQNNSYSTNLGSTNGLRISDATPATSERGYYTLTVAAPSGGTLSTGFVATATATAGGQQARDFECGSFTINEAGRRGALRGDTSADNTATCWK